MDTYGKDLCEAFLQNPKKNPKTGKPIKIGGPVHTELVKLCKNYVSYPDYLTSNDERLIHEYCTGVNKTSEAKTKVKTLMKKVFNDPTDIHILDRPSYDPYGSRMCRAFVPSEKEMECQSYRRQIIVMDFLEMMGEPLRQDYSFCDVTYIEKIKYGITYIPVPYTETKLDLSNFSGMLNSNCNVLLIHIDSRIDGATSDMEIIRKFINMVDTYLTGYKIPIVVYNFSTNDGIMKREDFPNITDIRILNVTGDHMVSYKIIKNGYEFIPFRPIDIFDDTETLTTMSDRLSCQWWFKRFFTTAFECGKGRLIQFSGTCYMTTVFNMIILGEYAKRVIIAAINNAAEQLFEPKDISYIKHSFDDGACVDIGRIHETLARVKYYTKIFYHTICGSKSVAVEKAGREDIFKDVSQKYFRKFAQQDEKNPGQGGFPWAVLFRMFADFGVNFLVADSSGQLYNPYTDIDSVDKAFKEFRFGGLKNVFRFFQPATLDVNPDFILYINTDDIPMRLPDIPDFKAETASIVLYFTKPDPSDPTKTKRSAHAITGFICDDYYKLYDAHNIIDNCDWRNPDKLRNNDYTARRARVNEWAISSIHVQTAIYVNYRNRLRYINEGVCRI